MRYIIVIYIFIHLFKNCDGLKEDYCDKGDKKCQQSDNISNLGTLLRGKSHKGNVIIRKQQTSLLECVTECLITSTCEAINYRKSWNLCELITNATLEDLLDEKGCAFSDISTWPKSLAGNCANHGCAEGKKCQWGNGKKTCVPAYCKDQPPIIKHATFSEIFGVSRDIGTAFRIKCNEGYYMAGRSLIICNKKGAWIEKPNCCIKKDPALMNRNRPRDCNVIPKHCSKGVYKISPTPEFVFDVYCHISNDDVDSNLLLIQRRWNNSTSFERNWMDYENGFGNLYSDFWLGNKKIHFITSARDYSVRFDLIPYNGSTKNVWYSHFKVGDSESHYKLYISGYCKNKSEAGSNMPLHNEMPFSTYDSDHDSLNNENCADKYHGGWWYKACHEVNLNGVYGDFKQSENTSYNAQGIQWKSITGHEYSLQKSEIWIRPNNSSVN